MDTEHEKTQQVMQRINALRVKYGWSYQDLANTMNEYLPSDLKFSARLTSKDRVSLNRWTAITETHWRKPAGDYLLAFQKIVDKYA